MTTNPAHSEEGRANCIYGNEDCPKCPKITEKEKADNLSPTSYKSGDTLESGYGKPLDNHQHDGVEYQWKPRCHL